MRSIAVAATLLLFSSGALFAQDVTPAAPPPAETTTPPPTRIHGSGLPRGSLSYIDASGSASHHATKEKRIA